MRMNNYNKLLNNLEVLNLIKIKENIDNYIELINEKKKDIVDSLNLLVFHIRNF